MLDELPLMFASEISREELHALPLVRFDGKIHLIERNADIPAAVDALKQHQVLGFDTETRPSFTKGRVNSVALLQFAFDTEAFLFRLCKTGIPPSLLWLIANPSIIKVGAALKNDLDMLKRVARVKPNGFIDIQNIAQKLNIKNLGLAKMGGIVLGVRISKSQQLSNWENANLTDAQQRYAATDAWMCYKIYNELKQFDSLN